MAQARRTIWSRWLAVMAAFAVALLSAGAAVAQTATLPATGTAIGTASAGTYLQSVVTDSAGNVYAVGYFGNSSLTLGNDADNVPVALTGGPGAFVAKYNAAGQVVWASKFAIGGSVLAKFITIDGASPPNVYVAGALATSQTLSVPTTPGATTRTALGFSDPYVVKLDGNGSFVWANSWGAASAYADVAALAVSSTGDVYIGGMLATASIPGIISRVGVQDGYVIRLNSSGSFVSSEVFGGSGASVGVSALAIDPADNLYVGAGFTSGALTAPVALTRGGSEDALLFKYDSSFVRQWEKSFGSGGTSALTVGSLVADASNVYFAGVLGATVTLPGLPASTKVGMADGLVVKLSAAAGTPVWATGISGANALVSNLVGLAVDGAGTVYAAGRFSSANLTTPFLIKSGSFDAFALKLSSTGTMTAASNYYGASGASPDILSSRGVSVTGRFTIAITKTVAFVEPSVPQIGTRDGLFLRTEPHSYQITVAKAGAGGGRVTSSVGGIDCGSTCTAAVTIGTSGSLIATADAGSTFAGWSGDCSGGVSIFGFSATASCTASFALSSGGGNTPVLPPAPPPAFVTAPPAANENASTVGSGTGSVSFAANYANPAGLTFTAAPAAGGSLPTWISFDPASVTFSYTVPLPPDLPVQPLADGRAGRADARANWANTVYPLLLRVVQLPVVLTATDKATGQSYASTIRMSFHAPRSPVAISAVSMSLDRSWGDRASGRSALSFDGGQMIFETAATNLFPQAASLFGDIVRYHGLSGTRERLSQTAIPGGGVANAANGLSSSPAVSANGAHAAFSSDAPSVSMTPAGGKRQVYRASLIYPRVALNPSATPSPDMVSATAEGIAGNGTSDNPSLSQDGRYVAFDSDATNFGPGPDAVRRVWRKDLATGEIVLVAVGSNPSISWDGRQVAFEAAGQIQVRDMTGGTVRTIGAGTSARLSARADRIAFVSASTVMHVDLGSGARKTVASGDQPAISADGRFVAWRSLGANGFTQISVQDVDRGATALVTQTAAGTGGNSDSLYPSLSGDGSQIGFASNAGDLVNGTPAGAQAYLAANPLPLPEKTGYWYLAASNGGQGWLLERWGNQAYVGGLVYDAGGRATWLSGFCRLSGLTCGGTLVSRAGGTPFGAASGPGPVAGPAVPLTLTTSADGRSTTLQLGTGAAQALTMFPIGGTATTGYAGLPQAGWWMETGSTGGNGYFIAIDSQAQADGSVRQVAYVSVLTFDVSGQPVWYSSQAALGADLGFSGTLMEYAAGSGATAIGTLRIAFTGNDTARINLPNGRTAEISRFRF